MLALLGMGRSKKEKEREKEPDKDHAIARADVGADSFAEDTCPSPGAVFPSGKTNPIEMVFTLDDDLFL